MNFYEGVKVMREKGAAIDGNVAGVEEAHGLFSGQEETVFAWY